MKLIVGLGNPGKEYAGTRHNMGYMAIDKFADMVSADFDRKNFGGVYAIVKHPSFSESFILAKPETYMNLSGTFVRPLANYYRIPVEDILIVYDDMAIEEGSIRLRLSGSCGSHNGMRNVIDELQTEEIKRLRIGIGEPPFKGIDYVLSKPTGESLDKAEEATDKAAKAIRDYLLHDFAYAMNHYN